ncbi:hypothetical protein C2S53_016311 [Perilla frutescens var. hirtella]|uniref:Senescence regulator n=1 Tax=Perilla frutescens var. hirtella TaxID=608512 RepID=A0AAD4JDI3_PERFH|nr:hypothetical protein C2S53_016311 [Perilla frutescens var. hirtella]
MAKGRKLTTSRSERFLGSFGGQGAANTAPELREEDVWSVVDDDDRSGNGEWGSLLASAESNRSYGNYRSRRPPSPSSDHHQVGGLSLAFDDSDDNSSQRIVHQFRPQDGPRGRNIASSAPVNVPDWSKIYRVDSVESLHDSDDGLNDSELVPPHEYLARAYSRKMAANSVFEGVGRTLKGRDMSRVRDAVWSQTGFDG